MPCKNSLLKESMEIAMYMLEQYKNWIYRKGCGTFHAPCNLETNSTFSYQKGPWKFSCTSCKNNNFFYETCLKVQ